jgi:hypothetical protein
MLRYLLEAQGMNGGQEQMMFSFAALTKRWTVSRDTLNRAARSGELRTVYLAGRRMVPRSEVERIEMVGFSSGRRKYTRKAAAQ